jgi:hypothetical protein
VARAEEFLQRVLPEPDPDLDVRTDAGLEPAPSPRAQVRGVDARTQARLEAMGEPDRESW